MSLRLLLLPEAGDGIATCLTLDASGRVLGRVRPTAAEPLPPCGAGMRDILAVPASATRIALLAQQAHSRAQARAAALRMFEGDLAIDHDELHVAVSEPLANGSRLAVAAASGCMRDWLARSGALGMRPHSVVPDALLLPQADGDRWQVVEHDARWLVRGPGAAFSAEPALAARLVPSTAQDVVDDPDQVEALLACGAVDPAIDLRQGEFAVASGSGVDRRARNRIAIAAGLLLASPLLLLLAGGLRDELAARTLQARAQERVDAALPGGHGPPASRTAAGLAGSRAGERTAADLGALVAAVTTTADGALEGLHYDAGQWRIELSHPAPAPPQALLEALAGAGMPATVLETRPLAAGDFRSTLVPATAAGATR